MKRKSMISKRIISFVLSLALLLPGMLLATNTVSAEDENPVITMTVGDKKTYADLGYEGYMLDGDGGMDQNVIAIELGEDLQSVYVCALKAGTSKLKLVNADQMQVEITVNVVDKYQVTFDKTSLELQVGQHADLNATLTEDGTTIEQELDWGTYNEDLTKASGLEVNANAENKGLGKLTAFLPGTYKVRATATIDSQTTPYAECTVTVTLPTVSMESYTYGDKVSTPSLNGNKNTTGVITYYLQTEDKNEGGNMWDVEKIGPTTLEPGTYYMYAIVDKSDDKGVSFDECKTETVSFTVYPAKKEESTDKKSDSSKKKEEAKKTKSVNTSTKTNATLFAGMATLSVVGYCVLKGLKKESE